MKLATTGMIEVVVKKPMIDRARDKEILNLISLFSMRANMMADGRSGSINAAVIHREVGSIR